MLRAVYLSFAVVLLLTLSPVLIGHQPMTVTRPAVVADGPSPMPPPIPLAQPAPLVADGPSPMPPPIPLAQPAPLVADGPSPMPPPIPLATPSTPVFA